MQEIKNIGKGTLYEFDKYKIYKPFPSRNKNANQDDKVKILTNCWYDKQGYNYELVDNKLIIGANEFFSCGGYSVVNYINDISNDINLTIILRINGALDNELAGLNMLCNMLSISNTNKNVIVDISNLRFSEKMSLEIDDLPDNVKITSMLNNSNNKEDYASSNEYFECWALNTNEDDFKLLLKKLTPNTANRIKRMREICLDFYQNAPLRVVNGTIEEKTMYAYNWCCNNISYDFSATNSGGTFNTDRPDAHDPILTFDNRKGVCKGRARLLKLLLNNYYMKVPCFCVRGMSDRLQHEWNEILLEDGRVLDLDISKQTQRVANDHKELEIYGVESTRTFRM